MRPSNNSKTASLIKAPSSGRLLERVLSEKPSNESVEDYLDRLASHLVGLVRPKTPTWMNSPSPGYFTHANIESAMGQRSPPSPSTSQAGPGSQSPSTTIPAPSPDMPILLGSPFAENGELDRMTEVPTSPGPSLLLYDEIRHASEQPEQTTPSTTPYPSPSQNTSPASPSIHLQPQSSPSTPQAGPGGQSPSTTTPASSSGMPMLLGSPFAENGEADQMVEVPTSLGQSLSLYDEIQHASGQLERTAPLTTPCRSHSQNTSQVLPSIHLRPQSPSPHLPTRQLVRNINMALKIPQALSMASNGIGDSRMDPLTGYQAYKRRMKQGIFNLLSFTWVILQLVNVGIVYSQMWLNSGRMHTIVLLHRINGIHPFLAQGIYGLVSCLVSLHTTTILYSCILYFQEAIIMATEVDPEAIIA